MWKTKKKRQRENHSVLLTESRFYLYLELVYSFFIHWRLCSVLVLYLIITFLYLFLTTSILNRIVRYQKIPPPPSQKTDYIVPKAHLICTYSNITEMAEPLLWLWTKLLTPGYSMCIASVISVCCCSMKHHMKYHWSQNIDHKCDITFIQRLYKEVLNIEWHLQHTALFVSPTKMVYNVVYNRILVLVERSDAVSAQTTTLGLLNY